MPGRLRLTTLGDLLGTLYRARTSGVLELVEDQGPVAGRKHCIELDAGLVRAVNTPAATRRLGELLWQNGFIGPEALLQLTRYLYQPPARRAGQILIEHGGLSPELVRAALRHQLRERLDAVYGVADARLSFRVPRPLQRDPFVPAPLCPNEFLYGRRRARDLKVKDPSSRATPRRAEPVRARALAVLGLPADADKDRVRRAFRELARARHPDRFPHASAVEARELAQQFAELTRAYHELVA